MCFHYGIVRSIETNREKQNWTIVVTVQESRYEGNNKWTEVGNTQKLENEDRSGARNWQALVAIKKMYQWWDQTAAVMRCHRRNVVTQKQLFVCVFTQTN